MNPCANTDWHVAFCHHLNRPLKGCIKFNEGSHCQVSSRLSHLPLAASILLAEYVLCLQDPFLFCCATYETYRGLNESMLDGDNRARVDRGVAPPMSYQCVCAASWILIERKNCPEWNEFVAAWSLGFLMMVISRVEEGDTLLCSTDDCVWCCLIFISVSMPHLGWRVWVGYECAFS